MRPAGLRPKFDGITRNGLDLYEERLFLYHLYCGRCQGCGELVAFDEMEVAHCIADTRMNKRRFGKHVVSHIANKRPTHRGRCNSRCNVGGKPDEFRKIVEEVECRK